MPARETAERAAATEAAVTHEGVADHQPAMLPSAVQVLQLQRGAGNHAVARFLASRPALQRQETAAPARPRAPRNDPRRLQDAISLEQLFALYATNDDRYVIGPLPPSDANPYYTRAWIRGAGQQAIQNEITARVTGLDERSRIRYLNYIENSLHQRDFDSARKLWLRDQVGATLPLTYDQRIELRRVVGDRMNDAYNDYTTAAQANADAIKAAVNAQAAVWSLFVDVFMGLAAPGLSRGIAALANNIPANASNVTYRVALAALDTSRTGLLLAAATKVGKENHQAAGPATVRADGHRPVYPGTPGGIPRWNGCGQPRLAEPDGRGARRAGGDVRPVRVERSALHPEDQGCGRPVPPAGAADRATPLDQRHGPHRPAGHEPDGDRLGGPRQGAHPDPGHPHTEQPRPRKPHVLPDLHRQRPPHHRRRQGCGHAAPGRSGGAGGQHHRLPQFDPIDGRETLTSDPGFYGFPPRSRRSRASPTRRALRRLARAFPRARDGPERASNQRSSETLLVATSGHFCRPPPDARLGRPSRVSRA
jgi:hypothetical protein